MKRTLTIHVTMSEIAGIWVGHCLDLDVVSQGESVDAAVRATASAVRMLIKHDFAQGLDPFARKPAPQEYWDVAKEDGAIVGPLEVNA